MSFSLQLSRVAAAAAVGVTALNGAARKRPAPLRNEEHTMCSSMPLLGSQQKMLHKGSPKRRRQPQRSRSYLQLARMLPTEAAAEEPVYVGRMPPDVTMETLRECLDREQWVMDTFLRKEMQARDMNWEPFLEPTHTPCVKVRRCTFVMPLPQDVPKVVASMVGLPKESNMTAVYRLKITGDEIMLVYQMHTHDVMFGDKFRAQDIHVWRPLADGGVEYRKWTSTVWLSALPWTHGVVKSAIQSKTVESGKSTVDAFISVFRSTIQTE